MIKGAKKVVNKTQTNAYGDYQASNYPESSINFDNVYNNNNGKCNNHHLYVQVCSTLFLYLIVNQPATNYYDQAGAANNYYYDQSASYYDNGASYLAPANNKSPGNMTPIPAQNYFQPQPQQPPIQKPSALGSVYNNNNIAANLINDPMASMAVNYGSALADKGKEYVSQNVSVFHIKYFYFF